MDRPRNSRQSGIGWIDFSRCLYRDNRKKQEKQRRLFDKYNNFTEEHIKPFYNVLSKYAYISEKFPSRSEPFTPYLEKILRESETAQENLKRFLSGTDPTIDPKVCVVKLTRAKELFEEEFVKLGRHLTDLFDDIDKKTTEFNQNICQLKKDTKEADSLPFVNMTQLTESLHENQQTYDRTTQQVKEYFSGNAEIDIEKSIQEFNRVNNELKVKISFLNSHRFSDVKGLNNEIKAIGKEFIKLEHYFAETGQTEFVGRLEATRKGLLEDIIAANADFGEYFPRNYAKTDENYQKMKNTSAPESIDDAGVGTSQPPEVDAGEGPSKPKAKSQIKDENLSPELIEQIVVAPTKVQLDSTLRQLLEVHESYQKKLYDELQSQLEFGRQQAHQTWKYAVMDEDQWYSHIMQAMSLEAWKTRAQMREHQLLNVDVTRQSRKVGHDDDPLDTLNEYYLNYMDFLDEIARTDSKSAIDDLLQHIIKLRDRNKEEHDVLSDIQRKPGHSSLVIEDTLIDKVSAEYDIDLLAKRTNENFRRIISLLDKGYDDRWKSNRQIRVEMRLIQEELDATKNLTDENKDKVDIINTRINNLVKFANRWIANQQEYEFEATYDEAKKWSWAYDNRVSKDHEKIQEFLNTYRTLRYNQNQQEIANAFANDEQTIQEVKKTLLNSKRQKARSRFNGVLQKLGFDQPLILLSTSQYKEILEGDRIAQSTSQITYDIKEIYHIPNIQENLIYIYNTCFNEDSKTDFGEMDEAISQLSDLSNKLDKALLYLSNKRQKKLDEEKYAEELPGALNSFEKAWKKTLESGALPNTEYLRQFSAKEILRIFTLGRVQYLADGNLKNSITKEPAYPVKLLNAATFVLEELVKGRNLSVEFVEDITRLCMKDTTEWNDDFTSQSRQNEDQWGYRKRGTTGFKLIEGNSYSKDGLKELQAKYEGRTGGSKPHSRYPDGHPIGNLLEASPDFMQQQFDNYITRVTTKEESKRSIKIVIDKYHEEIQASDNDDQILDADVYCCQELFQAHLLNDGHTRIIAGFIFNFLQLKHGFPPIVIEAEAEAEDKLFAIFSHAETKNKVLAWRKRLKPHEETSTL